MSKMISYRLDGMIDMDITTVDGNDVDVVAVEEMINKVAKRFVGRGSDDVYVTVTADGDHADVEIVYEGRAWAEYFPANWDHGDEYDYNGHDANDFEDFGNDVWRVLYDGHDVEVNECRIDVEEV